MIAASVDRFGFDPVTGERVAKALEWCRTADPDTLELGRNEIDGDLVFANVMRFDTAPADTKAFEAHRAYIDVHYVFSGTELMAVAPTQSCRPRGEFDEQDDFVLLDDPDHASWVVTPAGSYCLTGPADAHKPGCCLDGPAPLFKACVKVRIAD